MVGHHSLQATFSSRKENLDPNTPLVLPNTKGSKHSPPNGSKKMTQMFLDCGQVCLWQ